MRKNERIVRASTSTPTSNMLDLIMSKTKTDRINLELSRAGWLTQARPTVAPKQLDITWALEGQN